MQKERNTTMDIFKAFACIGVVLMHIRFPGDVGNAVRALGCFGVPLFFCVSGFWLSSKSEIDSGSVGKKLRHIVSLIAISETFYILFAILMHGLLNEQNRTVFYQNYFNQGWIERWAVTNAPPVYAHLWFLYALAEMYLLIFLFIRNKKQLHVLSLGIPFLLLGLALMQEFSFLRLITSSLPAIGLVKPLYWAHTVVFRAVPWFLLGVVFHDFSNYVKKLRISLPAAMVLIIISEIVAVIESLCFNVAQFYVGNMVATILIMITCVKYPHVRCQPLEYMGGSLFTWIYVFHVAIQKMLGLISSKLHISSYAITAWITPIVGVTLSVVLAIVVERTIVAVRNKMSKETLP